jgi:hypothetical protein
MSVKTCGKSSTAALQHLALKFSPPQRRRRSCITDVNPDSALPAWLRYAQVAIGFASIIAAMPATRRYDFDPVPMFIKVCAWMLSEMLTT